MKKIAFVINEMATGGVQQSLLNLINEVKESYDISLIIFYLRENERKKIPDGIKTIVLDSPYRHLGMSKNDVAHSFFDLFIHAAWVYFTKMVGRSAAIRLMSLFQRKLETYDCAISFIHEARPYSLYGGCNEFVLKKIPCSKRIAWIHCDYTKIGASEKMSNRIYSQFDTIVACSEGCEKAFIHELPDLANKCHVIRNIINYDEIREKAGDGYQYDKEYFNIITVARLSEEKGLDRAIEAIAYCIDRGQRIKYHIVGSGDQKRKLQELVIQKRLHDNVIFYDNQENPYYYMKNADLFLLTSYHEAAPMVIDESTFLGVPVFSTKTTSTDEMLVRNNHGIVCENNTESIKQMLFEIINNKERLEEMKKSLIESVFNNDGAKHEIYKILG